MDRNLKQEALPNAISGHEARNWTALHDAAAAGDDRCVQVLLTSNTDRLAKESGQGNTPLHEAASRGFSRCVKLICMPPSTSASTSKTQHKDKSRLKARVANTIEALHNATLSIINNEGLSALHLAAQNGHNQSSRELLMAGADPDVQNKYGDTALHTACRYGHAGVTRILLSALCDPNKTNLNGDTALHITCAMGRRKLTRILLEADARMSVKNAQGDTPQSIAMRKNYREILEILNTPKRIRNRKEKPKDNDKATPVQEKDKDCVDKAINWSPYGCHYFPDPRSFPSPKLETLPKEPLKQGEQYFLDLAGHIHKGPVSVGNTCYCGPFFRHIENKLNCNRKSLKKYVHKTKERLGHKVQALAMKTNDQIEQLTRTMIEDRMRCESKRQYLNEYLRRGEPMRSTFDNQTKSQRVERTLSRCRSLDLLDSNCDANKLCNSKSVEVLENDNQAVVTSVYHSHHGRQIAENSDTNDDTQSNSSTEVPGNSTDPIATSLPLPQEELKKSKLNELKLDFLKVSERLGDLLEKTSLIMERENEEENKLQLCSLSPGQSDPSTYSPGNQCNLLESKDSGHSPNYDEYTHVQRRYPNSSETSNPSQNSNSWEFEMSPSETQKYYHCITRGDNMLNTVIKALRKDASFADLHKDEVALNENADRMCGDKLMYKAQQQHATPSPASSRRAEATVFDTQQSISNLLKRQALCLDENFSANSTLYYTNPNDISPGQETPRQSEDMLLRRQSPNDAPSKVEIRNSEIKYLRKPISGQVKDMVAQLQGKIDSSSQSAQEMPLSTSALHSPIEFSSRLNNNLHSHPHPLPLGMLANENAATPLHNSSTLYAAHARNAHSKFDVPKDAYFHDLPNRVRNLQRAQPIYSGDLTNSRHLRSFPGQQLHHGSGATFHVHVPSEYANQTVSLANGNEPQHLHSNVHVQSEHSIRGYPMSYRGHLPPDVLGNDGLATDGDEIAAVGLYNNVSSLV
ncbi:uncharacterized protein LOC133840085 isoform X2 [Drosophila sulfurigaster albostrigata]|nr:uncharacterized protein LOC133840085 isoform X2 [Drosophila sulfurigaster albostrigata]XP_062127728.1 uncharacterized protein LOC133840085 isoform X2 [Drosophila sulfurigaster albostrigata]XP_062127729.1 uncharacterized protein LOC133840085 isoform X2 [Drosophila sulfurigaster albostrigata]